MKQRNILYSFDEVSPEPVKPEQEMPAPDFPESAPRRVPSPVGDLEHSYTTRNNICETYRHWGINE